jgi:GNAT superfamily N-acetyltransferase
MRLILAMKIKRVDVSCPEVQTKLSVLQKKCLPLDKPYDTTNGYWWIVVDAQNIECAFAGLVASSRWSDTGYLCRAGVIPSHRGHGIQKRLIRARIRQARELNWNWVITDTYHNPASANSLISVGFKMFEPTIPWGANGTLYWRFNLRK